MGCGESKHSVATANSTITKKKTNGNNIEVKDIAEDKELKGNNETGSFISKESPNRYFSSRKDEDLEGIVSDKSEYFSPRIGSGKDTSFNDSVKPDDSAAGETLVQETQTEEPEVYKEEKMAKEGETGTCIEPQVPNPDEEKKQNAEEEKLGVPPS